MIRWYFVAKFFNTYGDVLNLFMQFLHHLRESRREVTRKCALYFLLSKALKRRMQSETYFLTKYNDVLSVAVNKTESAENIMEENVVRESVRESPPHLSSEQ